MQLTDTPEGKSSLQIRLHEAEKRAREAEVAARGAQATLARTLLEAARVEAVVTARVKAESEAEISALRSELDAVRHATAPIELPEPGYRPIVLTEWDRPLDLDDDPEEVWGREPSRWTPLARGTVRLALLVAVTLAALAGYSHLAGDRGAGAGVAAIAPSSGANWLLYMPVERAAVAHYLGGHARANNQLAVKEPPDRIRRN